MERADCLMGRGKERRQVNEKYFVWYTIVFLILFFLCFGVYLFLYKKTFFRSVDGFDQHYISFMYLGKWGRSIIKDLFVNHHFSIPLWDQAIGYGSDIPTSLTAYLWDPFNWISFFIPAKYAEVGYAAMIIMKFYACGIAYSIFAQHRKYPYYSILCGAVIYTFSAVGYVGFYQSFFINPLIIFPLLILGVDILFEKKKPVLYVVMLAIAFVNYFYFAYMMCILVFLYCVIKLIFSKTLVKNISNIVSIILRFLLYSVIAVGISAVSLLPNLIVMLQAGRIGLPHYLPIWFDKSYYKGMVVGWTTSYNMLERDCNIGWGAFALICVIVLFIYWEDNWKIKVEFILMTAGVCIPMVGHVMNGMSYTTNRWVFAYNLLVAFIVTMMVPKLRELKGRRLSVLVVVSVFYIIVSRGYLKATGKQFDIVVMLILMIILCCFVFSKVTEKQFRCSISLISCISVVCMAFFCNSKEYGDGFRLWKDAGTAYSTVINSGGLPLLNKVDTSDGTRYDHWGTGQVRNASWMYGVSGMNFYISIYNDNIDQFHSALAMNNGISSCFSYDGLDRRSELESLMGVNHYFTNGDNPVKPVGFDQLEADESVNGSRLQSYKPDKNNSIFYSFEKTVSYDEFNVLSPYEKQQVLLQACVVDSDKANSFIQNLNIQNDSVDYELIPLNGVYIEGGTIHVAKDESQIELRFPDQSAAEMYLYLDTVNFENGEDLSYSINVQGYKDNNAVINLGCGYSAFTYYSHLYGGKLNWLLNLGYIDQDVNRIVITFNNEGTYNIKDIKLYARDYADILNCISSLKRTADSVSISNNHISCNINLDQPETVFTSIPYSSGWKAYDNGRRINVEKTDIAFMSFELDSGEHHIELVYRTPGLYVGVVLTIISMLVFFILNKSKRLMSVR